MTLHFENYRGFQIPRDEQIEAIASIRGYVLQFVHVSLRLAWRRLGFNRVMKPHQPIDTKVLQRFGLGLRSGVARRQKAQAKQYGRAPQSTGKRCGLQLNVTHFVLNSVSQPTTQPARRVTSSAQDVKVPDVRRLSG